MPNHGENLLEWLRDAHAMEKQSEHALRAQARRISNYPGFKASLEQHLCETLGQQRLLEKCIDRLGGKPPELKDAVSALVAFGQGALRALHPAEVVKSAISICAFQSLQLATYTSLIAAAKTVGDAETRQVCEELLYQEQAMATSMLEHLPELTQAFLLRDAAGLGAKG
jgi:ferritin-like metal-binding protein YciE